MALYSACREATWLREEGGRVRKSIPVILIAVVAVTALCQTVEWVDEFDGALLDGWRWIRETPDAWNLTEREGFLRIETEPGGLLYDSNNARNLLLRDPPEGNYEIETLVYFEPYEDFQMAGLVLYEDDSNFLMLGRAYCGYCGGNKVYFDFEQRGTPVANKQIVTRAKDMAYLKVTKEGPDYFGYYSENGTDWTLVIKHRSREMRFGGVGLVTTGDATPGGTQSVADFAYFRITELPATTSSSSSSDSDDGDSEGRDP